jgi:hypothetical protein
MLLFFVIASVAKRSTPLQAVKWIASLLAMTAENDVSSNAVIPGSLRAPE